MLRRIVDRFGVGHMTCGVPAKCQEERLAQLVMLVVRVVAPVQARAQRLGTMPAPTGEFGRAPNVPVPARII